MSKKTVTNKEIMEKLQELEQLLKTNQKNELINQERHLTLGIVFGVMFSILGGVLVSSVFFLKTALAQGKAPIVDILTVIFLFISLMILLNIFLKGGKLKNIDI